MRYFKKLVGERIYLSPLNVEDAEKYVEWFCDFRTTDGIEKSGSIMTVSAERQWIEQTTQKGEMNFAIVKLENDLNNSRYYYAFSEINDRGYDKYTGEYHWRITMIDKADLSHKYYLEGYFDSNTNELEIILNEEKINQIGKIILITFFVIITYILINSIIYMRKKRNQKENIESHEKDSKYGIVSLILLIISIILLCVFFLGTAIMFSILSIIFGIIALVKKEKKHCTIIAILSIILSSIVIIIDLWNLISIFIPIGNIFL